MLIFNHHLYFVHSLLVILLLLVILPPFFSDFRILHQINPVGSFEAIWTSQNTNSKSQAGIWAPSLDVTVLHSNKTRICLGHYANKGLGAPSGTSRLGSSRYFMVELTDGTKSRISGDLIRLFDSV